VRGVQNTCGFRLQAEDHHREVTELRDGRVLSEVRRSNCASVRSEARFGNWHFANRHSVLFARAVFHDAMDAMQKNLCIIDA